MPSGPAPGGPAPGGLPSGGPGGPTPNTGNFGPSGGYNSGNGVNSPGDGPGGNNQGGAGPIGGAPMGGGSGPVGRQNEGSSFTTTGASTATPSAFADPGTFSDPRGNGPSDRMPDQRGVPSQPNQGLAGPPPAAGFGGPQPGGGPSPQSGGPAPQQGGPGARPFGPGSNPGAGQGFGPRPDTGGPDALNRPPQSGQPHPGTQPGGPRPGTGPQPGGPRPDMGTQPGGPATRPDGTPTRPDATARPNTGTRPDGNTPRPDPGTRPDGNTPARPDATTRPDTSTRPDGTRPDSNTPARPDATTRPDGNTPARPDATTRPDGNRSDATARPDTGTRPDGSRPDGNTPTRPDATTPARPDATTRPDSEPGRSPEPDVSRSAEPDVSRSPDDNQPINGEDSDGPTPDTDGPDTTDADTDAPPVKGEADDGPPVDEEGVPLNYLGNRQGEHRFADMGEYIPMGGDRSNGMGSYDQRVAPLIADHNPWGEQGSRDEFNAHYRPDGTFRTNRWPDNDGAVPGSERQVTLPPGTVLDRFGAESGRFLSPLGTDGQPYHYRDRAIFPDNAEVGYHVYVVDDPNGLPGELADVAPALGQPGGGRQFTLPEDVKLAQLIADGTLREVHVPPADGRVLPESFGRDNGDGTQNADTVSVDDANNGVDTTPDTDTDTDTSTPPLPDNLRQVADNSSFRTPAGGALFDPSDVRTRDAANAVAPIDGHFVLDVHSDGQQAIVDGQRLNGQDLADLARNLGWNGTDPIILNGCEAGRSPDGLAADLARASGAQVIAPTERSWSGEQNTTPYSSSVDSVDDRGRARPTIPPDGGWRSFDPDGNMRDAGQNGLPVDNQAPSTPGDGPTPDDGPAPSDGPAPGDGTDGTTPGDATPTDQRQPVPHGDDVDRGRIQSPWNPPTVTDPGAPHTINVDNNAAASANPNDPHRPLRDGERLIGRTGLTPNSQYNVPGRGTYYTDGTGTITHADLQVSNTQDGITAAGADRNPDASYPEPNTTYRIDVDGSQHVYTTDDAGLPPRYTEWNPPAPTNGTVPFPSNDPTLPPNHDLVRPPTLDDPLNARTGFPPNSQIEYVTPHGTTRLYTGDVDPNTGTARVEAIDTYSSPGSGSSNRVRVDDLNPELNNFPPNTVTRINGQDVYVTNEHGVTYEATDERTYGDSAPRSGKAQGLVAALGTGTDGGHIRPTGADGAPDARNQFPQDSDENRPKKGQTTEGTWYGQDRAAHYEQDRGTTHEWHDLETEGSHTANPAQPTAVHERWVMRDSNGNIRLHFRRYDN